MAVKIIICHLLLIALTYSQMVNEPFSSGYSMGNLGTILWKDGTSGAQSMVPAAFCDSSVKNGLDVSFTTYYDEMDNLQDERTYQVMAGYSGCFKRFKVKIAVGYFNALNTYFDASAQLSGGIQLLRSVNMSLDLKENWIGLLNTSEHKHSVQSIGAAVLLSGKFASLSFRSENIVMSKSRTSGVDPEMKFIIGVHTAKNRLGAQGVALEITPVEEFPLRWKIGEEVLLFNWLGVHVALENNPVLVSLGLSIELKRIATAISTVNNSQLGWSKGIYLRYSQY